MLRLTDFQSYIDATILVKTGVFYWVQIKKSRKLISETQANIEQYFLRCFPVLIATYIYKNGKHHTLNDTTWYLKKSSIYSGLFKMFFNAWNPNQHRGNASESVQKSLPFAEIIIIISKFCFLLHSVILRFKDWFSLWFFILFILIVWFFLCRPFAITGCLYLSFRPT